MRIHRLLSFVWETSAALLRPHRSDVRSHDCFDAGGRYQRRGRCHRRRREWWQLQYNAGRRCKITSRQCPRVSICLGIRSRNGLVVNFVLSDRSNHSLFGNFGMRQDSHLGRATRTSRGRRTSLSTTRSGRYRKRFFTRRSAQETKRAAKRAASTPHERATRRTQQHHKKHVHGYFALKKCWPFLIYSSKYFVSTVMKTTKTNLVSERVYVSSMASSLKFKLLIEYSFTV